MDSATLGGTSLGELDLQLLHALHLDGRAPFSRIAEVLGVSDRTAARRFARLRAAGAARVTAVLDSRGSGHAEWLVRLRVPPPAAADLARELARRPDTAWVTVLSSGTEIVFIVRAPAGRAAPLAGLARHPRILGVEAHRLLRHLMEHRWPGRTSALTGEQVAALRPAPGGVAAPIALNDLDRRLLPVLAADGRAAYPRLAGRVGWSESAVRRRLEELRRSGALRFDVEVDPVLLGFPAQCLIWLAVAPSRLASTARALAADPQAAFVGAVTGPHNLLVIAVCRDEDALYAYLSDRLGSLDGVERVETAPITSYAKRVAPPT
ncbi:DNA-binding Lrp family transcriptional regulator [Actinomadura luteofluorescens]|uniref:DNA-binding Lrp family transcriptional regulator n=1 Tax=Actinomadura luteofluorescens TaxID=46163 RepID=A0A7Y9EJ80_9ACTN|nr:AsnC family transcriptional regulator [Actinomadura luteofluorescens]NYD48791.1 DNA-binding Lrp family transcriptional regulator [Actinomadura luteofluorescens]